MASFSLRLFALAAVALVLANSIEGASTNNPADLLQSTLKIGRAMCAQNTEDKITPFFECYSHAPGKPQFMTCQNRVYGTDMSTTTGVAQVCESRDKVLQYAGCLRQEFKAANVDMFDAVGQVNKCQSYILGVE